MKIPVKWTTKSIDKAIKEVEKYRKHLVKLFPKFLERCADRLIEIANNSLDQRASDIDSEVLATIKAGWEAQKPIQTTNGCSIKLINNSDKATYIEFGVGEVGGQSENASVGRNAGYEYNLASKAKTTDKKTGQTVWWFKADGNSIDIAKDRRLYESESGWIKTAGQPATMFLFNAFMDFVESEAYLPIWNELAKGL